MTLLLDTHFLIWILLGSRRLKPFGWLEKYQPWGLSPATLLEMQFLSEVGRIEIKTPDFYDALQSDPRFVLDEPPFLSLVRTALPLSWTRDPFDRLLAGHSSLRRVPLCTTDDTMIRHHSLLPPELT